MPFTCIFSSIKAWACCGSDSQAHYPVRLQAIDEFNRLHRDAAAVVQRRSKVVDDVADDSGQIRRRLGCDTQMGSGWSLPMSNLVTNVRASVRRNKELRVEKLDVLICRSSLDRTPSRMKAHGEDSAHPRRVCSPPLRVAAPHVGTADIQARSASRLICPRCRDGLTHPTEHAAFQIDSSRRSDPCNRVPSRTRRTASPPRMVY